MLSDPRSTLTAVTADDFEDILAECLLRIEEEGIEALEVIVAQHPDQADRLRQRIMDLRGMRLVGTSAESSPAGGVSSGDAIPDQVGPFKVVDILGEGGMGTVYLAEQSHPVQRQVALKVIKLGMDSAQVLQRFEAERQALAMMEHSNIARVFEAGATERGQPWFAMEYVKGRPITQYCDEHKLRVEERLKLFRQLCIGVQHAHHKGVIHRDLKPSNVLVTEQDGVPTIKIIDFGVARATDRRRVEETMFTRQGAIIGTPEYMSPEQAGLDSLDIDTRSDVYSLGVLLYELLVGQLPFSTAELREAGFAEMERKIREEDPPRPSTRLTEPDVSTRVAELRRTDVRDLLRRLKGDLDWIAMKALEKDRVRRYETAQSLAEDIDRYLVHEPVLAGPPARAYRMKKFIRRYRLQVVSVAVVFLALVAGTIGTAIGLSRASAESARRAEQAHLAVVERDRADAEVNFMLIELMEKLQPIGRLDLLEDVALRARSYYESHSLVGLGQEERRNLALSWRAIGEILTFQGRTEDALSALSTALEIQEALMPERPNNLLFKEDAGQTHLLLGHLLDARGDLDGALSHYRAVRSGAEDLAALHPGIAEWQVLLAQSTASVGTILSEQGDFEGAFESFESALEIQRRLANQQPDGTEELKGLARFLDYFGTLLRRSGDLERAVSSHSEALEIRRRLVSSDPTNALLLRDVAQTHTDLGAVLIQRTDLPGALDNYRESLAIMRKLVGLDPANSLWKWELSGIHNHIGVTLRRNRDPRAALTSLQESLRIREELVSQDQANAVWKSGLFSTLLNIGNVHGDLGDLDRAAASLTRAAALCEELVVLDPANTTWKNNLGRVTNNLGILFRRLGDQQGAITSYQRAQEIREKLLELDPKNAAWRSDLADSTYNLGNVLRNRGDFEQALLSYERSKELYEELVSQDPANIARRQRLASLYTNIAGTLSYLEEHEAALAQLRALVTMHQDLVALSPTDNTLRSQLYRTYVNFAQVLAYNKLFAESAEAFVASFEVPRYRNDLRQNFLFQGACSAALAAAAGDGEDAARWREQALSWLAEDMRMRTARMAELEKQILAQAEESDAIAGLESELEDHRRQIDLVRTGSPELETLRGLPEFAALFDDK